MRLAPPKRIHPIGTYPNQLPDAGFADLATHAFLIGLLLSVVAVFAYAFHSLYYESLSLSSPSSSSSNTTQTNIHRLSPPLPPQEISIAAAAYFTQLYSLQTELYALVASANENSDIMHEYKAFGVSRAEHAELLRGPDGTLHALMVYQHCRARGRMALDENGGRGSGVRGWSEELPSYKDVVGGERER